ncbi:diacylglycerol kinase [Thiorhodococcus mannitoliphagus]|uniref:Diacylglycerol kinase n=1 Tax=Thiorhodococcus mannitoliphagus TaxID=329406 RepID=A0A6P1DZ86_9GAMM|nr:diacylglycerol kinase [Thiorhodococcus mannitoliphagus]NEX21472.1 diacylglycerol kinase [Thiorhodococcus mannitoliphagus]
MANHNVKGWRRVLYAFRYSVRGLKACFEFEEAFRQEVFLLIPLIPLGIWLGESPVERAVLIGSLLVVPIIELLNSAIEANVDRVGLEKHELSGRAKDIASAAVLSSIAFCVVIWALILLPKLF